MEVSRGLVLWSVFRFVGLVFRQLRPWLHSMVTCDCRQYPLERSILNCRYERTLELSAVLGESRDSWTHVDVFVVVKDDDLVVVCDDMIR